MHPRFAISVCGVEQRAPASLSSLNPPVSHSAVVVVVLKIKDTSQRMMNYHYCQNNNYTLHRTLLTNNTRYSCRIPLKMCTTVHIPCVPVKTASPSSSDDGSVMVLLIKASERGSCPAVTTHVCFVWFRCCLPLSGGSFVIVPKVMRFHSTHPSSVSSSH